MHRHLFAALCLLAFAGSAPAAPSPTAKREIQGLMDALSASSCEFQRNGTWHGRDEARKHLQRKYDYLLKKRQITTTESFIDLAASRSSVSGRAYRVQCGQSAPVDSAAWFTGRLSAIRAGR